MKLTDVFEKYIPGENFCALQSALDQPKGNVIHLNGLIGSAAALLAALTYEQRNICSVVVCSSNEEAKYFATDLENLLPGKTINYFPASYKRSFQPETIQNQLVLERAEVLNRLNQTYAKAEWVITSSEAMLEFVMGEKDLNQNTFELKVGDTFDLEFFIEFLTEHHFERSDFVYEAGHFSIRGGIIDVFSFSNEKPYRIELNGDVIEGIRIFEPYDQLSVKKVDRFYIIPNVQKELHAKETLFNYLPKESLFWLQDYGLSCDQLQRGLEKVSKFDPKTIENKEDFSFEGVDKTWLTLAAFKKETEAYTRIEFGSRKALRAKHEINFKMSPQPVFHKNFTLLIENLRENSLKEYTNLIFSESSRQIERLYTIFDDLAKDVKFEPIYHGLSNGFIDHTQQIAFYTEHQIFDRFYKGKVKSGYSGSRILTLKELRELRPGDYVTHIDHGIGKFAGLEKL
ncbi:MAG: CarD family transcriptional regulator, partial [Bacteroidia bacterium]